MEPFDLIVRGGTVVRHDGRMRADIGVRDGKIAEIGSLVARAVRKTIDADGRMVIPGVIDPHVHLSILPSAGEDELQLEAIKIDLVTESQAAAFGGVTTFLPMINLQGPYVPHVRGLVEAIEERCAVDAGATVIVSSKEHVEEIPELAAAGISGFKHFLNAFPRDQVVGSLLPIDDQTFFESLAKIHEVGRPALAMVHAEDADLNQVWEARYREANPGTRDLRALSEARPPTAELLRTHFAAVGGEAFGVPVYLCHCTSYAGLALARSLSTSGRRLSVEAVTHCLTTNCDEAWRRVGVWGKFFPPIRERRDQLALWGGVRDGAIGHIASDHTTWTRAEKENGAGQFGLVWDARPGIANGMEHLLPALVTYGIRAGEMSWEQLVRATSYNTASLFGYLPEKGDIAVGADADLVVVDESASGIVDEQYYHGRGRDWSLYWGEELFGRPEVTVLRGQVVQQHGELLEASAGRFVRAATASRQPAVRVEA